MAGITKNLFHFWGPKRLLKDVVREGLWREREEEEVYVLDWEEEVENLEKDLEEGGQ